MQTKEKKRKERIMICIGIGVLRKRLLLARRCSYCTIFALSTSLIIKNIEKSLREP